MDGNWPIAIIKSAGIQCVLQAAMKAVVATSRMHEGSKRRTDSCEISASGTSRQSSMQQDPPPESTDPAPETSGPAQSAQQATPTQPSSSDENTTEPSVPYTPRTPEPPPGKSDICQSSAPNAALVRPPLRADGLRPASVIPKDILVQSQRSHSAIDPAHMAQATPPVVTPPVATPPSPNTLSNGFSSDTEDSRQ